MEVDTGKQVYMHTRVCEMEVNMGKYVYMHTRVCLEITPL